MSEIRVSEGILPKNTINIYFQESSPWRHWLHFCNQPNKWNRKA